MEQLTNKQYIAHIAKDPITGDWLKPHLLKDHLTKTSKLAHSLAKIIGSDWAKLTGQLHDLGKYRIRFQDYIRIQTDFEKENANIENGNRAPHSTAGAIHAVEKLGLVYGHILAYIISGHHAGLPDWIGGKGSLSFRLQDGQKEYEEALLENIPNEILNIELPELPDVAKNLDSISLWIRLLFSCLVDADFLDTESYMNPCKASDRVNKIELSDLHKRFNENMSDLLAQSDHSRLNQIRKSIYDSCLKGAKETPGMFSLTVPTGGGKTLSSLAFALEHAKTHLKDRIIYAIPFTSIIEQNADVFRKFVGNDAVLEHHSNFDIDPSKETAKARLATENWDAPLIVTTNVQLYESLFASRTSKCRKLHNIVNSIIILDEAQQIPRDFYAPITQMMQQMSDYFGVTWVLCTATQPVLTESTDTFGQVLLKGLSDVREIIPDPIQLSQDLQRVTVQLPTNDDPKVSWQELASEVSKEDSVLVIVNTRKHAKELFELLIDDGCNIHLSANMCAQHRTEVIEEIKERLDNRKKGDSQPLRVISTQLIEAGVDVDFPVVYRAMAGLDSIAQAAGRCNREGKLKSGTVVVFKPEQSSPIGFLKQGEDVTTELMASNLLDNPLSPESFEAYFTLLNCKGSSDKHNINDLLKAESNPDAPLAIQFREAAQKFRLINDTGETIIVPFTPKGETESPVHDWLNELERNPLQKWIYRKLQRYTITLPESVAKKYHDNGCVQEKAGQFVLLENYYSDLYGVDTPEKLLTPEESVY